MTRRVKLHPDSPVVWIWVALGIGLVLDVVGFSTNQWSKSTSIQGTATTSIDLGLWRTCSEVRYNSTFVSSTKSCIKVTGNLLPDYHEAAQALECVGLVAYVAAVLLPFWMIRRTRQFSLARGTTVIVMALAGSFVLIGGIVFLVEVDKGDDNTSNLDIKPGYSSALCLVAGCVALLCAVLLVIIVRAPRHTRHEKHHHSRRRSDDYDYSIEPVVLPPPVLPPQVAYTAVVPGSATTGYKPQMSPPTAYTTVLPSLTPTVMPLVGSSVGLTLPYAGYANMPASGYTSLPGVTYNAVQPASPYQKLAVAPAMSVIGAPARQYLEPYTTMTF